MQECWCRARLCSSATSSSLLPFLFPGMLSVPCRAELFWSESDRLPCPFSAAGAAGSDVTAAETQRGPMGAEEEEAPPSILHRCTREKEEEEESTWQMSPERRNLVPGETINSSLQWLREGLRTSGGPAAERGVGESFPFVFRDSGRSGWDVLDADRYEGFQK